MKILFAASECVPFVKTGGLADVVGALPKRNSQDRGGRARDAAPVLGHRTQVAREDGACAVSSTSTSAGGRQYVGIEKLVYEGITFYFIDNEQYFGRDYIYGYGRRRGRALRLLLPRGAGSAAADRLRSRRAALPRLADRPDSRRCCDAQYQQSGAVSATSSTVFTIHNLQYQGIFPIDDDRGSGLAWANWAYTADSLEFYGMCSFMKGGIVFADQITTVSPTYAQEIQTAYYGERLDGLLRARGGSSDGHPQRHRHRRIRPGHRSGRSPSTTPPTPSRRRPATRSRAAARSSA